MDTEDDYEYDYSDDDIDFMEDDDDEINPVHDAPVKDNPNAAPTCSPVSVGGGT